MTSQTLVKPDVVAIPDRLDFALHDFTRLSWVSDRAREAWEPRVSSIVRAWHDIEWLAVAEGVHRCCVSIVSPGQLIAEASAWTERGLIALPVEIVGASSHAYSSLSGTVEPGKSYAFRVVLGTPWDVADFKQALDSGDQAEVGAILGCPSCCREFFHRVWVDQGLVDTTWPMAWETARSSEHEATIEVGGPPQTNILWRWIGLRAAPHFPCRFDCAPTVDLANQLVAVGRRAGYAVEMEWLQEILSWPVEWSALHGIAEIKTPIVKIATRTDATASKYTVRRKGAAYPAEGGQGVGFPYQQPSRTPLTATRAYQRGLRHPLPIIPS